MNIDVSPKALRITFFLVVCSVIRRDTPRNKWGNSRFTACQLSLITR
ncbi:hypothetical protein AGR1C_Lc20293 [Agrobacterium fabacearum TT111]|nr:hypothetical protein AGR1C_Lc20293 [Agrobacterium fabacearum TT111]